MKNKNKKNMNISIIVSISENNAIGKDNKLLWHLGDDLKRFKKLTKNKVIIMGQKTYESLPIKPLPKRINIVITDDYDISYDGCIMAYGINDSIEKANYWSKEDEIFVIGGGSIYKQFFDLSDKLYITKVYEKFDADTFFPEINDEEWGLKLIEEHTKDENNDYDFSYMIYEKLIK